MAETDRFKAVLLLGGPGCGKGTQGAAIGAFPHVCHLAMGDIFRALDKQSNIGKEFLSYSTKGLLVPDELTIRVWRAHVDAGVADGSIRRGYHTLLLDGIPRTKEQVGLMNQHVDIISIIHLLIRDENVLIERLKGRALKSNRPDDANEDVIRERLRVYNAATAPLLDAYDAGLIAEINADQPPFAVLRDIADCLANTLPPTI